MVDKVIVNPVDVRGLGNIVSPKSLSDFSGFNSKVTSGTDSVGGEDKTVFSSVYLTGSYMSVSGTFFVSPNVSSVNITCLLKNVSSNGAVSQAPVKCYVNDVLVSSKNTNNNGSVSFTIPLNDTDGLYNVHFVYDGVSNLAGCTLTCRVVKGVADSLLLTGDSELIQTGESCDFFGVCEGASISGERVGVEGVHVYFYSVEED